MHNVGLCGPFFGMRLGQQILRLFWLLVVGFVAGVGMSARAQAQDYPTHSITVVVGFPPGGPTDTVARIVADQMSKSLGQSVIVENIPGAAGTIGGTRVARSKPDGYTLSVGQWTSNVGGGVMYPLSYHVMDDFEPVALLTTTYLWIVGRKDLPADDLRGLIAWLKENPGKASTGSIGVGSAAQVCTIEFQNKTETKNPIVQYRGGAPAVQDLLGGQIDFICIEASQTLPHVQAGQLKVFGVAAKKRWFAAPEPNQMRHFPRKQLPGGRDRTARFQPRASAGARAKSAGRIAVCPAKDLRSATEPEGTPAAARSVARKYTPADDLTLPWPPCLRNRRV